MIESILPAGVHYKIAEPWMWDTQLCPAEEALITRAVAKRQREFRAGRHSAHTLFEQLQIQCTALLKGQQREPAWPPGWVGSISHTNGFCAVTLAAKNLYQSIGFDVEQADPLKPELRKMICRPEEIDLIQSIPIKFGHKFAGIPFDKILFSAKESIHKTYFPLNYHTLDFLDARIELHPEDETFTAYIVNPEPTPKYPIKQLHGRYCTSPQLVATFIALPR